MSDINISTPKELGNLIAGKGDAEINAAVDSMGVDTALDKVFEGMTKAFLADKAKGQAAVIQWDIKTSSDTKTYQVNVAEGKCTFAKGAPQKPRVTLSAALPDFLRVITG